MVRFKNRYLVIEANPIDAKGISRFKMKSQALYSAIMEKIGLLHGDFGLAAVKNGFSSKYCSESTQVAYIRARHGPHRFVATAIPLVTKLEGIEVTLRTIYTGGSVMQCNKFLRDFHIREMEKKLPLITDEEERKKVQEAFLCFRQVGEEKSNINP